MELTGKLKSRPKNSKVYRKTQEVTHEERDLKKCSHENSHKANWNTCLAVFVRRMGGLEISTNVGFELRKKTNVGFDANLLHFLFFFF